MQALGGLAILIGIALIYKLYTFLSENPAVAVVLGLGVVALVWALIKGAEKQKQEENESARRKHEKLLSVTRSVAETHKKTLYIREKQTVYKDAYGDYKFDRWNSEKKYFIKEKVFPALLESGIEPFSLDEDSSVWLELERVIDATVSEFSSTQVDLVDFDNISTGQEYEIVCQEILENLGWAVNNTPTSGDQGADLIAEKEGCRLAIQCKFYSSSVGNKAVQEVVAATSFYVADFGVVVSNNTFTKSARQLAVSNGVILIHHDDLESLDELVSKAA
ncbi:restriction endonuclease [Microvirga tunisiensis]|uniref:Restriction endonuclease n=1 Tax=Microvirga tunisiensis TaxID=2108360 RepID=A0A5N7MV79_9HYPH|nr:restriction endonuclease [Microvirga tunisiensis]MPR12648.1 restriction endonuclease [Microvirga tunisiensis]MPR30580.1 restriction endonuclease [Microvirga tunisiensis]